MPKFQSRLGGTKMVVIVGPTASGKSGLGIFLAQKLGGEVISADSRQVYRGMDIGTGKITKKERAAVKHYMLDVADPKKVFTVSDFKKLGLGAINQILRSDQIPFIVGGTGFYVDALVRDIPIPEVPPNRKLRAELEKTSAEQLFKQLKKLDPVRARNIDPQNKRRLIRALEIIKATGKPIPKLAPKSNYEVLWLGLKPKDLDKKIEKRLDSRLKQGMVREVKKLMRSGVSKKRLYDLGLEYRWVAKYLNGEISRQEMRDGLLKDIIKYSKRQMTWFKRNKDIHWLENRKQALRLVKEFLLV
jgi:tRNA dimethylallyltransferase